MASTVLTFEWQPMFLKANRPFRNAAGSLCSPQFGNEKMRFCFYALKLNESLAKIWCAISLSSTVNEIVANIEYRTSKVKEFSGEFTKCFKIFGNTE